MHSSTLVLLLLLWLVITCHAYSAFKIECSVPSNSVNFVYSPDTRGTLNIVFSSVATILTCTWSILHLNVPKQRVVKRPVDKAPRSQAREKYETGDESQRDPQVEEGEPDQTADESRRDPAETNGFWTGFRWTELRYTLKGLWTLRRFWSNLKWMFFTIVAPEIILAKALGDLFSACKAKDSMKRLAKLDGVEWGVVHSFYANMGGFVGSGLDNDNPSRGMDPLTAYHIFILRTTEFGTERSINVDDITAEGAHFRTNIEKLPNITEAEINDKSKQDAFLKAVTLIQVSWAVLQTVVRAAKGLSASLLELTVVAFSACTIVTYLLLLYKPQGVQIPTPITLEPGSRIVLDEGGDFYDAVYEGLSLRYFFLSKRFHNYLYRSPRLWRGAEVNRNSKARMRRSRLPNDTIYPFPRKSNDQRTNVVIVVGIMLGGGIFGFPHIFGWNGTFPTNAERILWRSSSILITVLLPIITFGILILICCWSDVKFTDQLEQIVSNILEWASVLAALYFLVRLFILIETVRTLFYLPPKSYIATWASDIPHVS